MPVVERGHREGLEQAGDRLVGDSELLGEHARFHQLEGRAHGPNVEVGGLGRGAGLREPVSTLAESCRCEVGDFGAIRCCFNRCSNVAILKAGSCNPFNRRHIRKGPHGGVGPRGPFCALLLHWFKSRYAFSAIIKPIPL